MKTVLWVNKYKREVIIEEHKMITGFGEPVIDPVETDKIVCVEILKAKESKDLIKKKKLHSEKHTAAYALLKEGADLLRRGKQKASDDKAAEYRGVYNESQAIMEELRSMKPVLKEVKKRLRREHAVYFEPKFGEKIISEEEFQDLCVLIGTKEPDELISIEGAVVKNPNYKAPDPEPEEVSE